MRAARVFFVAAALVSLWPSLLLADNAVSPLNPEGLRQYGEDTWRWLPWPFAIVAGGLFVTWLFSRAYRKHQDPGLPQDPPQSQAEITPNQNFSHQTKDPVDGPQLASFPQLEPA